MEGFRRLAVLVGKDIGPGFDVEDRLVDMHRRARLAGDRLGHEGGVHVVTQRRLADRPLEQEHLVGQLDRIAVPQIDLHLRRAVLMRQRIDLQPLRLGEFVDVVE